MKEEIDENKEKEVIQKAYKYNGLLGIWIIAVFISFLLHVAKIITGKTHGVTYVLLAMLKVFHLWEEN